MRIYQVQEYITLKNCDINCICNYDRIDSEETLIITTNFKKALEIVNSRLQEFELIQDMYENKSHQRYDEDSEFYKYEFLNSLWIREWKDDRLIHDKDYTRE